MDGEGDNEKVRVEKEEVEEKEMKREMGTNKAPLQLMYNRPRQQILHPRRRQQQRESHRIPAQMTASE